MEKKEIKLFLESLKKTANHNIVIIDFGNVEKWKNSLGWTIGIKELSQLIKHISIGKKYLRRFYYGKDYGPDTKSTELTPWSQMILNKANMSNFEIKTKKVKYIPDSNYKTGFIAKCDLDLEIAVDLIKEEKNYNNLILFSGDGDFYCLLKYLKQNFNKTIYTLGARDHVGAEIYDALHEGIISKILYAEDFEYRLSYRLNRNPQFR